jgi:tripartite ATP-independent transporter DctP family solute receptor
MFMTRGLVAASALILAASLSVHAADKIVLKWGEQNAPSDIMAEGAMEFAKIVKEKSKDRIEIAVYLSSQLGDEKTQIQSVQMGALDFFRANANITAEFGADKSNVLALPYIFRNRTHLWNVLNGPVGKEILENFKEKNTRMLGIAYFDEGPRHFMLRGKQVKSVADLKGLKIRVSQTAIMMDTIRELGASPAPISYAELYSALQSGVVDGAENPITAYLNNKFYEVAKYYTLDGHVFSPSIIVMSEATAKKLSPDDLKLVMDAAVEAGQRVRRSIENREADAAVQLKARGTVITDVADNKPWQDAAKPVVDKYGARYKKLVDQIQNTK